MHDGGRPGCYLIPSAIVISKAKVIEVARQYTTTGILRVLYELNYTGSEDRYLKVNGDILCLIKKNYKWEFEH